MNTVALILATGLGESMKSALPPTLHPILGDPALLWILRALPAAVTSAIVVSQGDSATESAMTSAVEAWEKKGLLPCPTTVIMAGNSMEVFQGWERLQIQKVVILSGEAPLVNPKTIARLLDHETAVSSGGAMVLPWAKVKSLLVTSEEVRGIADAISVLASKVDMKVEDCDIEESRVMASRRDQAALQALARDRVNGHWMDQGITFLDSNSTFVGPRVVLAQDVFIDPCVCLEGSVQVASGCRIGRGSVIKDCIIGEQVEIKPYTIAQEATIGAASIVGPFSRLREGTILENRVHVGNFVETKKTTLKTGAKANHLSYLGDAEVGEGTNIGAGLITCNYDGFRKHRTIIGRKVFVGSDCQLVAPVNIGDGALIGAGSTITEDIPPDALAFTRAPLVVKEGGAKRLRDRLRTQLG